MKKAILEAASLGHGWPYLGMKYLNFIRYIPLVFAFLLFFLEIKIKYWKRVIDALWWSIS